MLVKLTEVCGTGAVTTGRKYSLREVFVNPEHVIMVREEHKMKIVIDKGTTGSEIVVVGDPRAIETALNKRSYVLKG